MPFAIYKLLHVIGLMLLFLSLGGMLLGARSALDRAPKGTAILGPGRKAARSSGTLEHGAIGVRNAAQ